MRWTRLQLLVLTFCLGIVAAAFAEEDGRGMRHFTVNGVEIKVFTYSPPGCRQPSILFVFHGIKRNAENYRDKAVDTARKSCLMVFAPEFDKKRFPNWRYQRGGVIHKGRPEARAHWPGTLLRGLIDAAVDEVKTNNPGVYLFGHSAGGQFLSRIAAFTPPPVSRIVVANPSTHVVPALDEDAPYGFGGDLFSEFEAHAMLKAYLAAPVSIYLGQEDIGKKNLASSKAAERQGNDRLQRGRTIFRQAQTVAHKRGWPFNWRLVEVPGVGHSATKMLRAPEFYQALDPEATARVPVPVELGRRPALRMQ